MYGIASTKCAHVVNVGWRRTISMKEQVSAEFCCFFTSLLLCLLKAQIWLIYQCFSFFYINIKNLINRVCHFVYTIFGCLLFTIYKCILIHCEQTGLDARLDENILRNYIIFTACQIRCTTIRDR